MADLVKGKPITYKEFKTWCDERVQDGQWGMTIAMTSIAILGKMQHVKFWKKNRVWSEEYESCAREIVEQTTRIAEELAKKEGGN